MGSIGDMLRNWLGGTAPVQPAPPLAAYPSVDDARFAQKSEFSYGSPDASYQEGRGVRVLNGSGNGQRLSVLTSAYRDPQASTNMAFDPPNQTLADLFTRAALAANRSPISYLGFDPRNLVVEPTTKEMTVAGAYSPSTDGMYVNDVRSPNPSAMVHEATHRGMEMLRNDPANADLFRRLPDEESVVRYLMSTRAGDPEKGIGDVSDKQRDYALAIFNAGTQSKTALGDLETAAQRAIQRRRPMGPR